MMMHDLAWHRCSVAQYFALCLYVIVRSDLIAGEYTGLHKTLQPALTKADSRTVRDFELFKLILLFLRSPKLIISERGLTK